MRIELSVRKSRRDGFDSNRIPAGRLLYVGCSQPHTEHLALGSLKIPRGGILRLSDYIRPKPEARRLEEQYVESLVFKY